ncbi:MAG: ATP-binding protein, partial [Verrucomicrobiota bacterium]
MISRRIREKVAKALNRQAAVALLGPRQVGKTTLARSIEDADAAIYLDLEWPEDRQKLADPAFFLSRYEDKLVILDEIHRVPEIFQPMRRIIDEGRRHGKGIGRFLILGSASIDLLKQSGESLAGRIEYIELNPLDCLEIDGGKDALTQLWVRGGFPDSYLAASDEDSMVYRLNFIRTYLERDVPQFGPRIPAETLGRLWTMVAHSQGGLLNAAELGRSLSITGKTINSYLDLLCDLLLLRRLPPYFANTRKRLVKSPKVYVRDSGLLHALLGIGDFEKLAGHPVIGSSWEGFAIENMLAAAPDSTRASFYRTSAGAEVDLVLELPGQPKPWVIEIKQGSVPKPSRGFHESIQDLNPERAFILYGGEDHYPINDAVEAIGLRGLCETLRA